MSERTKLLLGLLAGLCTLAALASALMGTLVPFMLAAYGSDKNPENVAYAVGIICCLLTSLVSVVMLLLAIRDERGPYQSLWALLPFTSIAVGWAVFAWIRFGQAG